MIFNHVGHDLRVFELVKQRWVTYQTVHRHPPETDRGDPYRSFQCIAVDDVDRRYDGIYK